MQLFPHFPIHFNPIVLFGFILLIGLLGGEIARILRLPRISGYILCGFIFGPHALNIATPRALNDANFFVDIALGLILFNIGRHLDLRWLKADKGLLPMSLAETGLTFIAIFILFSLFHFPLLSSALAAAIAAATSPAVVMMVTHDINAEGPITRRTLILTSLNNLIALVLFTLFFAISHFKDKSILLMCSQITYRLGGSVVLGIAIFALTVFVAHLIGKKKESQFILFVSSVAFGIGLAISLELSTMLTLFVFGLMARNFDVKHKLTEVDFGWLGRIFFVLLFVVTGVYLNLKGFWQLPWLIVGILLLKLLAKMIGVSLFGSWSKLTKQQTFALGLTLLPMAELTIGLFDKLIFLNPPFSDELIMVLSTVIALFYILGPLAVQFSLIISGEASLKVRGEE